MSRYTAATTLLVLTLLALCSMIAASPLEARSSSGRGTFFEVGLGACGNNNVDSDHIVALATADYDNGAHCGKKISITANGKTTTATVEDECPGCSSGDLDMSPSLFNTFANEAVGVVKVTWKYV